MSCLDHRPACVDGTWSNNEKNTSSTTFPHLYLVTLFLAGSHQPHHIPNRTPQPACTSNMSADAENPEEPAKASIGRLLIPTPFVVGIAAAMSYAADLDSFPVEWGAVWTVAVVSFVIQWIAFIPAAIYDTEHCKSCAFENLALPRPPFGPAPRRAMPHRTVLACRTVPARPAIVDTHVKLMLHSRCTHVRSIRAPLPKHRLRPDGLTHVHLAHDLLLRGELCLEVHPLDRALLHGAGLGDASRLVSVRDEP